MSGFERPVSRVRYNLDGDLLFASGKEKHILSWRGEQPQPLGAYLGHTGAVNDFDIQDDSFRLISASADTSLMVWDTETAAVIHKVDTSGPCVLCGISLSREMFFYIYTHGESCTLDVRHFDGEFTLLLQEVYNGVPVCAIWGCLDEQIIIGLQSGKIAVFELATKTVKIYKGHNTAVTDIQMSRDYLHFVTCSSDTSVLLWDVVSMEPIRYTTGIELNSVSLSPFKEYFICSGGVHSSQVTHTKSNILDIIFFDVTTKKRVASVINPHNGPVNSLRISPDGKGFISCSEDSSINTYSIYQQPCLSYA